MWMWYNDYYDDDGDHWDNDDDEEKFFEWYDGYKKRKAQEISIKKEFTPIAWHLPRYWDWCISKDEKKRNRKMMEVNRLFCI